VCSCQSEQGERSRWDPSSGDSLLPLPLEVFQKHQVVLMGEVAGRFEGRRPLSVWDVTAFIHSSEGRRGPYT
jgi:hypothetical protein